MLHRPIRHSPHRRWATSSARCDQKIMVIIIQRCEVSLSNLLAVWCHTEGSVTLDLVLDLSGAASAPTAGNNKAVKSGAFHTMQKIKAGLRVNGALCWSQSCWQQTWAAHNVSISHMMPEGSEDENNKWTQLRKQTSSEDVIQRVQQGGRLLLFSVTPECTGSVRPTVQTQNTFTQRQKLVLRQFPAAE